MNGSVGLYGVISSIGLKLGQYGGTTSFVA